MKTKETYVYYTDASYSEKWNCYTTAFSCSCPNKKERYEDYFYMGDKLFETIQANGAEVVGAINIFKHVKEHIEQVDRAIIYYDNYLIPFLAEGKIKPDNYVYLNYLYLYYDLYKIIELRKVDQQDPKHRKVDKMANRLLKKHTS